LSKEGYKPSFFINSAEGVNPKKSAMATKIIEHTWKLSLPNSFLVDHSMTDGKQRDQTYDGPDKIYLQIGADGKEHYGPLTEDDIADGRPKPADVVQWFEVDCARSDKHALICQLRGPVVNEKEESRDLSVDVAHPGSPDLSSDGYQQFTYGSVLYPDDVWNYESITVTNPGSAGPDDISISAFTAREKINGVDEDKTWDMVRSHRNRELSNSDGAIAEDMPDALKTQWKTYRQQLRDLPGKMTAASVHPNIADMMFPMQPDYVEPPRDAADSDGTGTKAWMPPG